MAHSTVFLLCLMAMLSLNYGIPFEKKEALSDLSDIPPPLEPMEVKRPHFNRSAIPPKPMNQTCPRHGLPDPFEGPFFGPLPLTELPPSPFLRRLKREEKLFDEGIIAEILLESEKNASSVTEFLNRLDIYEQKVDLCFVVDVTGSMQVYIDGVRDSIFDIVTDLTNQTGNSSSLVADLRIAFVGYRDFDDGPVQQFKILDFSNNVERFREFVAKIPASGGFDAAEDVLGGLSKALELEWGPADRHRLIFHLADAPGHGCDMHLFPMDSYSTGDPLNRTAEEIFDRMNSMNIDYFFGNITRDTETMLERFYRANRGKIATFDVAIDRKFYTYGGERTEGYVDDGASEPVSLKIRESVKSAVGTVLSKVKEPIS